MEENVTKTKSERNPWLYTTIVLGILLVASLGINYQINANIIAGLTAKPAAVVEEAPAVTTAYIKGDANAPVKIVECSEFQCPYCKRYIDQTYGTILENYVDTGKASYEFRHFPLSFHQYAQKAAEATECAGEQGKFWEYHDILFANQANLDADSLKAYAVNLGLDATKFDTCLDSGKYEDKITEDMNYCAGKGVSGTPSFIINGQLLVGAQPYSAFQQVIESALSG